MVKTTWTLLFALLLAAGANAENGYRLWLRYDKVKDEAMLKAYRSQINYFVVEGSTPTLEVARKELKLGLVGLLDEPQLPWQKVLTGQGIVAAVLGQNAGIDKEIKAQDVQNLQPEGYLLYKKGQKLFVIGKDDKGVLYGVFHLLRHLQTSQPLDNLHVVENPKLQLRILNHWDNLDRTVERGYAGLSIWNWHTLPDYLDPRYTDYARANASIGINGMVLTNVNANALVLRSDYLEKVKALADLFRPYNFRPATGHGAGQPLRPQRPGRTHSRLLLRVGRGVSPGFYEQQFARFFCGAKMQFAEFQAPVCRVPGLYGKAQNQGTGFRDKAVRQGRPGFHLRDGHRQVQQQRTGAGGQELFPQQRQY